MHTDSVEEWDRIMSVNVRGVMLSYKYAALQMIKQGRGGRIIGAASTAGKAGFHGLSAYSSSKFAVRGLTQCVALELLPHKITVNAYAPTILRTPMASNLVAGWEVRTVYSIVVVLSRIGYAGIQYQGRSSSR